MCTASECVLKAPGNASPSCICATDDDALASFQAAAPSQPGSQLGLPQDIPRCSSALAATVRRLLRQQPGVVRLEGQLPDDAFPGLFGDGLEEEQSQPQRPPQGAADVAGSGRVLAAGGNARPAPQQLSIAERVRKQLAAKTCGKAASAKAAGGKAAVSGRKRAAVQMEGAA